MAEPDERITIDEIKKHKFYLRGKKLCHFDYKAIEKNVFSNRTNINNKSEIHSFRQMLLNNNTNTNTKYEDNKESQYRINSIYVSKGINIDHSGFNDLKNNTNRVKENSKNSNLNKFLQNFGKSLKINADINEKNILQQKGETNRNNKFIPTMILNENNYHLDEHENNNSTFSKIQNNFIKKDYLFNKHKILLNFGNNKNGNLSIVHYNYKINLKNKVKKKDDIIFSNSFHQLKLINGKANIRNNNYLYCNNLNININNYNIKTGSNRIEQKYNKRSHTHLNINTDSINKENLINRKYINYNRNSNKIISSNSNEVYLQNVNNKDHSIWKLDGSKKLYFNRENLLNIDTNNNNENSFKTQQNFYKPRKYFNFDKISFHSSSNKKQVLNGKNNLRFKEKNGICRIDDCKRRGGSEGRAINHSKLDKFLVKNNEFYKNKNRRRNQKV